MPQVVNDIIQVNITRQTAALSQIGFGTLMFASQHTRFPERIRYYTSAASLLTDGFVASDNAYKAAEAYFGQELRPQRIAIGRIDAADANITASLNAINDANADFYKVAIASRVKADVLAASAWVESMAGRTPKFFVTATAEAGALTTGTTDNIAELGALSRVHTYALFHEGAGTTFPEVGLEGRQITTLPGESTYKFKTIQGFAPSALTETQILNVFNKGGNVYVTTAGSPMVQEGIVAKANPKEFIDTIIGIDWLQVRLAEGVFRRFYLEEKVPFTEAGFSQVYQAMDEVLSQAVRQSILAVDDEFPKGYKIFIPNVLDIPVNDRANRLLTGVKFSGRVAGAIHGSVINGTVGN